MQLQLRLLTHQHIAHRAFFSDMQIIRHKSVNSKAELGFNVKCLVQGDTKKRELLKNPTKIEEIQEKKNVDRN